MTCAIGQILLTLVTTALAAAMRTPGAVSDPIQAGYQLLFDGQKTAAAKHFETLLQSQPERPAGAVRLAHGAERTAERRRRDPAGVREGARQLDRAGVRRGTAGTSRTPRRSCIWPRRTSCAPSTGSITTRASSARRATASKAKGYIETYLKQHPEDDDAYFVLGLYNYYVEIAPAFVKVLRVSCSFRRQPGRRV